MSKINKLDVANAIVSITKVEEEDYICLTDMAKIKEGDNRAADVIKNWIRTRCLKLSKFATRAPLSPLKGRSQRAVRAENQRRHYDERLCSPKRSEGESEEVICSKLLTDSFVSLAMTIPIDCLLVSPPSIFFGREQESQSAPLSPLKGKIQRAVQEFAGRVGSLAPLGDRGSAGMIYYPLSKI